MEKKEYNNICLAEENDVILEKSIRPNLLNEYIGQDNIKELLNIYIKTSIERDEALDHVLLYGPPGLGKTTLARIISNEINANFISVQAPSIKSVGEIVSLLLKLKDKDILFIDEIHRLSSNVMEILYQAMEDFKIDLAISKKDYDDAISLKLNKFTLVGATTNPGLLTGPLRDRFGIILGLNYYTINEMQMIIKRSSSLLGFQIDDKSAYEIARRSRYTPRVCNRLLKRVRDFAQYSKLNSINIDITLDALDKLSVDEYGLNETDILYLKTIIEKYKGGPVGLNAICATLCMDSDTICEACEPFLLKEGFIIRSSKGRVALDKAYKHLGY